MINLNNIEQQYYSLKKYSYFQTFAFLWLNLRVNENLTIL